MKRLPLFTCLAVAGLLWATAGCSLPTEVPRCTPEQLRAPISLSPNSEIEVVDPANLVTLRWSYPVTYPIYPYATVTCKPDFFELYVWTGAEPASPGMTGRVNYDDEVSPGVWQLSWPIPLQPGNSYYWRVYAGLETGPGPDVKGPSALGHFYTGPRCTTETIQPVNLLNPPDGASVASDEEINFVWDDPTSCLPNARYEIDFSDTPTMSSIYGGSTSLRTDYTVSPAALGWESCKRYYWRVVTDVNGTLDDPISEVRSLFVQPEGILCPPSGLRPEFPIAIARLDLNCRLGPSPDYPIEDAFYAGEQAPIEGRSADGGWWLITSPTRGARCWVWAEQVDVEGDTSGVEIVEAPPLVIFEPTLTEAPPTTVNCSQYTDPQSCVANPACQWHIVPPNQLAPSYCENK